jgi:ATP-dependent DNA helicase RecQ
VTDLHATLKRVFGYDTFRPLQEEIVSAALDGADVFALLPTGGGKSLLFSAPGAAPPRPHRRRVSADRA